MLLKNSCFNFFTGHSLAEKQKSVPFYEGKKQNVTSTTHFLVPCCPLISKLFFWNNFLTFFSPCQVPFWPPPPKKKKIKSFPNYDEKYDFFPKSVFDSSKEESWCTECNTKTLALYEVWLLKTSRKTSKNYIFDCFGQKCFFLKDFL